MDLPALFIFLPGLLYLCIMASYTDIKYGKIRNRDIMISLVYSFIAFTLLFSYQIFMTGSVETGFFIETSVNILFSIVLAFTLFYFSIWSAGDGKLFIAFAIMVPITTYSSWNYKFFNSSAIFVNSFIAGFIITSFLLIKNIDWKSFKAVALAAWKRLISKEEFFSLVLRLFAASWLIQVIASSIGIGSFIFEFIFTILLVSNLKRIMAFILGDKYKKAMKSETYMLIGIIILRFLFDSSLYTDNFWWEFIILIVGMKFISSIINQNLLILTRKIFVKNMDVKRIKEGMILENPVQIIKNPSLKQKKNAEKSGFNFFYDEKIMILTGEKMKIAKGAEVVEGSIPLSPEDVAIIKKMKGCKLPVVSSLPFAPMLSLGVLITLIVQGNIIFFL